MKKLIQLDRLDGNRKGVIKRIAEEGKIITNLFQSFSADQITNPEIFPSLLFYYGMLTITHSKLPTVSRRPINVSLLVMS